MKRIKILNKRIEKIFQKKNDQDLITKLKSIKPSVNIKCPESYLFFKTQFNTYKTEPKKSEQKLPPVNTRRKINLKSKLVIRERNAKEILPFNLLSNHSSTSNKNNNNFLRHYVSGKNIFESSKIFDENITLSKRIREKSSYYSLSQWKEDFKKSREYKKISCEYPSINFVAKLKKKYIKRNHAIFPKKYFNSLSEVQFIPLSPLNSFNNDNINNNKRIYSKYQERNKNFDSIRRKKFLKLLEQNNKIIFDTKYNKKKNIMNIEHT